jgi:Tfp pilus assembly protein PilV
MKLKSLAPKPNKSQRGFTIVETMTGAMISFLFLGLGANLVLVANVQKVVAKKNFAMNSAIETDMESIQYQANQIAKDNTKCNPSVATAGYAAALREQLGGDNTGINDVETTSTLKILNHNYVMTRTIEPIDLVDSLKTNVLPVSYQFKRADSGQVDYTLYVEIIPAAALTCSA